ncbi:MAG: hypothetical protein LBR00_07160 [Clostridiales Family XIII bacterium]|nr:hypothetical protein [Clostridiales Family XIII bacterium]
MNTYLSHITAAELWGIPDFHRIAWHLGPDDVELVPGLSLSAEGIATALAMQVRAQARAYTQAKQAAAEAQIPFGDITVSAHGARPVVGVRKAHSCEVPLPRGAVVTRDGRKVASPELVFLELAAQWDVQRLILLGLQMCGHPPGEPEKAITTKKRIASFVARAGGHRGHRKAERAARYLADGSGSFVESLAFMILTLPHALGGYKLGGAVFNHEVSLRSDARRRLAQNRAFIDLYYPRERLAVEYQSFAHHHQAKAQGHDLMRAAALERQGIVVLPLSTIQLYDTNACREFAENLAARLGKRLQIRTAAFSEMHGELRSYLPTVNDGYDLYGEPD